MSFLYFLEDLRHPVLDWFFSLITLCGDETVFMAVGMIVFWCVNKYQGYYLLCVGFLGTVLNQFLKILCRIPRPWVRDPSFTIVESAKEAATGYSFPSGHTQSSVGLFGGICRITKYKALRIAMIVLAILVPFSRMYLGVHTPADVLVSVAIAMALIFLVYPLFQNAENSPRRMYGILLSFAVLVSAYLCFVSFYPFPGDTDVHNLGSARENGYTLLGCVMGMLLGYTVDRKWIRFETHAVWWAQILKTVGGILLVLATKELLRAPLDALFGGRMIARSVRYFAVVTVAAVLWPLSFRFFAKLGVKKESTPNHS